MLQRKFRVRLVARSLTPPQSQTKNISPVLNELHKGSLGVGRGSSCYLLHLLHTGYATDAALIHRGRAVVLAAGNCDKQDALDAWAWLSQCDKLRTVAVADLFALQQSSIRIAKYSSIIMIFANPTCIRRPL